MRTRPWLLTGLVLALIGLALWLRWPTFGFSLWNVDEAIHAAAARVILDGGVLYRDAVDLRTPLSYYAVAGVFAVAGENNLWAVRFLVALLVAGTGWLLLLAGRGLRAPAGGTIAAVLYVVLSTCALFQGDANAANTEWFVAFFTSAAAAVFLAGGAAPSSGRLFATGFLLGGAFLSKQPALLDAAAPVTALVYAGWLGGLPRRVVLRQLTALAAGWLAPVFLAVAYFAAHGALGDAVFCTWTYNLSFYGPEIAAGDRLESLLMPFLRLAHAQPWVFVPWLGGALVAGHRLLQRAPTPLESAGNPSLAFLAAWSAAGLAGAASAGRGFDHYLIQFLPAFCLGAGLVLAALGRLALAPAVREWRRGLIAILLAVTAGQTVVATLRARERTLPSDPSLRVSAYIREHSRPSDRISVWGFHPDIYLFADRRPASRYFYASFATGLIPWTNTAPETDTAYAIVPGSLDTLLRELTARPPLYLVDCSAGPNRHWQKYPPEKFPPLHDFIRTRYELVEAHQFVPQGFRLYRLRPPGEAALAEPELAPLPAATLATLRLGVLATPLAPVGGGARFGITASLVDGRREFFAHAPATLVYRVPAGGGILRGGFGIKSAAYGADNRSPTDGAEFIIRWRPAGGTGGEVLRRRLLRPHEEPADRGLQSFEVALPASGGELELATGPGPAGNVSSDWTYWTDLTLENSH